MKNENQEEDLMAEKIDNAPDEYSLNGLGILVLAFSVYLIGFANDAFYGRFKELSEILGWPALVLAAIFFFRRIFTYLFFSMEKFNFFGAKGTLIPVEKMIRSEAKKLREYDEREKKFKRLETQLEIRDDIFKRLQAERKIVGQSIEKYQDLVKHFANLYQEQTVEITKLKDEIKRPNLMAEALKRRALTPLSNEPKENKDRKI